MRPDSRLPRVLHALLHLGEMEHPITSDQIGEMLAMNPSQVRRMMSGLRKAGLVSSTKGHHGGWVLERSLSEITLAEIYAALGAPQLFAVGLSQDSPTCLLERAANAATETALQAARNTFESALTDVNMADLAQSRTAAVAKRETAQD